MTAYYNEFDPKTAAWLREVISRGLIAPGDVDERSIVEVSANDLKGYTQCHFFAGIGGWPYALKLAGWPDDRPVWSGSCPCPPFSTAGKRQVCPCCKGPHLVWCPRRTGYAICSGCGNAWLADDRHLWPELWRLISERGPSIVFGEQVASADGLVWLAGVRASLEICQYAFGATDYPSAGVNAPNTRQRLWWVAESNSEHGRGGAGRQDGPETGDGCRMGDTDHPGPQERRCGFVEQHDPQGREIAERLTGLSSCNGRMADAHGGNAGTERQQRGGQQRQQPQNGGLGFWDEYDLIPTSDGKTRRIEPGTFPLAHGILARVVRLRGYGNAINPVVAARFIQAYNDIIAM